MMLAFDIFGRLIGEVQHTLDLYDLSDEVLAHIFLVLSPPNSIIFASFMSFIHEPKKR